MKRLSNLAEKEVNAIDEVPIVVRPPPEEGDSVLCDKPDFVKIKEYLAVEPGSRTNNNLSEIGLYFQDNQFMAEQAKKLD
jgi:hypothetical protein